MSVEEVKFWQAVCDICFGGGPIVQSTSRPDPPEGWQVRTLGGCGLTGYTRHDLICPYCWKRIAAREAAESTQGGES